MIPSRHWRKARVVIAIGATLALSISTSNAATLDVNLVSPTGASNIVRLTIIGTVTNGQILQVQGTNLVGISTNNFAGSNSYRLLLEETNTWTGSNNFTGTLKQNNVAVLTNIPPNGANNALVIWLSTNSQSFIPNGIGMLTNDGNGNFGFTTNVSQNLTFNELTVLTSYISNYYAVNGKNATLIVTNFVQFPFTTLTMSGSNVSTINLTNSSMYKLDLTNDAFFGAPSNLPGTNWNQGIQIWLKQDSTGGRSVTFTNSSWHLSGSGTSTNAIASITTNANAVSIITFGSSPFDITKLHGVVTP